MENVQSHGNSAYCPGLWFQVVVLPAMTRSGGEGTMQGCTRAFPFLLSDVCAYSPLTT